jgi:hypothetical protein
MTIATKIARTKDEFLPYPFSIANNPATHAIVEAMRALMSAEIKMIGMAVKNL